MATQKPNMASANQRSKQKLGPLSIICLFVVCLASTSTVSARPPEEFRTLTGIGKFVDAGLFAPVFHVGAPRWASRFDVALGVISESSDNRAFVSVGPVWRWQKPSGRFYVEVGASPTLLAGSRFGDRDLGGIIYLTSSFAVGRTFGLRNALSLRIQHTSNGGLNDDNPGMDFVGLSFVHRFSSG